MAAEVNVTIPWSLLSRRLEGVNEVGNSTSGGPPRSYYDIYGLYFVAAGVIVCCSLAASAYWALKRRATMLSVLPIYILYISLGDFVSDCTFVYYMPTNTPVVNALRQASFVFVLGASFFNIAAVAGYIWWVIQQGGDTIQPFKRWLDRHKLITGILLFASLTSARMMSLLTSGLFEMTAFSAPLPISLIEKLELIGLITVLLEDVPQLIVTVVISTESSTWDSVAFTALAFSVVSIALSVSCRVVIMHHISDEERQRDDSFNPEYLKAHKAYKKGSLRTLRHLYSGADEEVGGGALSVETRMPESLAAALRVINPKKPMRTGWSSSRSIETEGNVQANPLSQLQPHDVYAAVSVPLGAPVLVMDKRRASYFRRSGTDSSSESRAATASMGVAYDSVAAVSASPPFDSATFQLAAARRQEKLDIDAARAALSNGKMRRDSGEGAVQPQRDELRQDTPHQGSLPLDMPLSSPSSFDLAGSQDPLRLVPDLTLSPPVGSLESCEEARQSVDMARSSRRTRVMLAAGSRPISEKQ